MVGLDIIQDVLAINADKSGDYALDGFEFQVSSAIYLIFEELNSDNEFELIYEKVEDFIIFTDSINLYQAKSMGKNITPNILYKREVKKKTKDTDTDTDTEIEDIDTGLSIIEKMQDNLESVRARSASCKVISNLILSDDITFSKKLIKSENLSDLKTLNFSRLTTAVRDEISTKTDNKVYDWDNINARRLIPKSRHEEITRVFIEDTIFSVIGENKINTLAFYNSLVNEIRKIRKNKETLSSTYLREEILKYKDIDKEIRVIDYNHLLSEPDCSNHQIHLKVKQIRNFIRIPNHPYANIYERIKFYVDQRVNDIINVQQVYEDIQECSEFTDIFVLYKEYELKALIVNTLI